MWLSIFNTMDSSAPFEQLNDVLPDQKVVGLSLNESCASNTSVRSL